MLHFTTKIIYTHRGNISLAGILVALAIMMVGYGLSELILFYPSFHLHFNDWPSKFNPGSMISFRKVIEVKGAVDKNPKVYWNIMRVVIVTRALRLLVINILQESKIIRMVGRKAEVDDTEVVQLIEKHIEYFKTNNFPTYGHPIWKTMSNELNRMGKKRWGFRTVYSHVRGDKHGNLTKARINQNIPVFSPKPKCVLVDDAHDVSDGETEQCCDADDEEWLPEEALKNHNLETFDVRITPDEWNKIRPSEEVKNRLKSKAWAPVISAAIKKRYNFECAFLAKASYVSPNFDPEKHKYFLKIHAYCADQKDCNNVLEGIAEAGPTANGLRLLIQTVDTREQYHRPVTRPLNGAEREEVKNALSHRRAAHYRNDLLRNKMEFGDNVPFDIRENHIYRQVRMERAQEDMGRKRGESIGVIQSLQNMSISPLYQGIIHDVGAIRFFVIYSTLEQILAYTEYVRLEKEKSEIAIDASGKMVRAFEICPGKKSGYIFLYTITIRYKGRTICLNQVLTENHTQEFIEYWLKTFKRLGAPAPGRAVSDYERAIPMSSCLAFNNMSFKEYIDTCFKWTICKDKKDSRPAKTLIRIDVAHLMHLVACWKSVKDERHKTVKETRLYCVALMIDSRTVDQFSRIFLLTNVISLHPFSDTIITLDGVSMKVLDALHELEDAIGNRRATIQSFEESMSFYEENKRGERIPEFQDGENDTSTHKFIKKLIMKAKPSPLDIQGTTVNGFYNEEFSKALEKICKEFPAWTGVTEPHSSDHTSSAYQEGYFASLRSEIKERVSLPCSADRFICEHLKSLRSGSNQCASDLKHANHQRVPHLAPTQTEQPNEMLKDESILIAPPRMVNLADDSDLKSVEPWGGLRNPGPFQVESDSSDNEHSGAEETNGNLKFNTRKSSPNQSCGIHLTDSEDSEDGSKGKKREFVYDDYHSGGPVMEDVVKSEKLQSSHQQQDVQSSHSMKENNIMEGPIPDSTIELTQHTSPRSIDHNTKDEFKLAQDKLESNSPLSTFTSTPLAEHSYAVRIRPDDLVEDIILIDNDVTTEINQESRSVHNQYERNSRLRSSNYAVDEPSIVRISDNSEVPILDPLCGDNNIDPRTQNLFHEIDRCKRKMKEMNVYSKKLKIDKGKVRKKPGHYFQERKELKILNGRLTSKKGLLLSNGNIYTKTIKINRSDKFEWKFDPELLQNRLLAREFKVRVINTCGLDSILHVLQFCAVDYPVYRMTVSDSSSDTLKLLVDFMGEGLTAKIQLERLKLLNKVYKIQAPKTALFPYFLNAVDSVENIWKMFMEDEPSGYRNFRCNNPACPDAQTKVPLINVNERILRKEGYKALEKALLYDKILYKVRCKKQQCWDQNISGEEKTMLNALICINLDVRDGRNKTKTIEGQLNDFPPTLELEKTYRLVGIIHHEPSLSESSSQLTGKRDPGHFTAYCLRVSGSWILCDDMKDKINYNIDATDVVKPHLAMYVIK